MSRKKSKKTSTLFGHYVVGVFDLLGQSPTLDEWDFSPETQSDRKKFLAAVQESWGKVDFLRKSFKTMMLQYQQHTFLRSMRLPKHVKKELLRIGQVNINTIHLSDTIIVYAPIRNNHGYVTASGLYGMVASAGLLLLVSLGQGVPFRGGIDVGIASDFFETGLYGPALKRAHYLESKVAKYPRIVVGENALKFLADAIRGNNGSPCDRYSSELADTCQRALFQDEFEGETHWTVEPLCDQFQEYQDKDFQSHIADALKFIDSELTRHEKSGDAKLAERYAHLQKHFLSRIVAPVEKVL